MTIEEFKEILNDEAMQSKQTNIRIIDKVNPPSGRLTISAVSQKVEAVNQKVEAVDKKVEALHQEVVELKDIVLAFITEQRKVNAQQAKFNTKQEKFNQLILNRIDNLVKKNNLKE